MTPRQVSLVGGSWRDVRPIRDTFDGEVEEAWAVAYGTLAGVMKEAAAAHRGRLAPCHAVTGAAVAPSS
jgi:hypothetical protein